MATLEQFLPMVRGLLPGCPQIVMENAVRDACIEFCKRTELLTQTTEIDVIAGEREADLYPDADTHWVVLEVRRSMTVLEPLSRKAFFDQSLSLNVGVPRAYYLEGDLKLLLGPIPDADETLTAWVATRPKDTATSVNDVLWTDYREPIAAGARAWVRRHYGEWSQPALEADDRGMFERAIHFEQLRRARGGTNASLRVRAHSF